MKILKTVLRFFLVLARIFVSEKKPGRPEVVSSESSSPGSGSDSTSPG